MQNINELESQIILKNRNLLEIKGIKKVNSLNKLKFDLTTKNGPLLIEGENLEMIDLNLDKQNILIKGKINLIKYNDLTNIKNTKKRNFFSKIFK